MLIILFSQYLKNSARAFELYPILMAIVGAWGVAALCTFLGMFEVGHPSYTSLDNFYNANKKEDVFKPMLYGMCFLHAII
mgnify:CR=1 FL=1